jgi:hypothetical protein
MNTTAERNFVLQQGFAASEAATCVRLSSALLFQPRVVGVIVLAGALLRSPAVFAALAALLAWSVLMPRWSPFDLAYNATLGRRPGAPALTPAPFPRRFAQGMAACFAIGIAAAMATGHWTLAWVILAFLLLALGALLFGRLCLGSFVYHLVRGEVKFAVGTLPWGRGA